MFSSWTYFLVIAVEILAIGAGNMLLASAGHGEYAITWVASVIGAHFLAFGRLFFSEFYWLGTALIAAGTAGLAVGLAGGGSNAITATSGLIAAACLLGAGGHTVARSLVSNARRATISP